MNNSNSGLIIHCDFYIKVVSVFINSHIYVPSGKYYLPFCPYSFSVISFLKMFIFAVLGLSCGMWNLVP